MSMGQTQAIIVIDDGDGIPLSRDQDVGELKKRIEDAASAHGFVDLDTADGARLSVLITPLSRVRIVIRPDRPEAVDPVPHVGFAELPADLL